MKETLSITEYSVKTNGRAAFTAAVVSDTHEADPEPILAAVRTISPDMILVPGDVVEAKTELSAALHDGAKSAAAYGLLRGLNSMAPVYYCLGNHEAHLTERQRFEISKTGVHLLEDKYARVRIKGCEAAIGGVSPGLPHEAPCAQTWRMLENFRKQDCFRILMCHEPQRYAREFVDARDDVVLAGHAHGGQWRLFGRGVYAPGQGLFPLYTKGWYGNMLVSAGAHNSEIIPRIANNCEVLSLRFEL